MNIQDLKLGSHYSNDDICSTFLCSPQGGMRRSQKTNTLVLVANHVKSIFDDRWNSNTMNYTGMGLKGEQSLDFMQNKTLNESNANGVDIPLFPAPIKGTCSLIRLLELGTCPFNSGILLNLQA